jgi:hypothetical protein
MMARALAGFLPSFKRRRASVGVFAFPSAQAVAAPSAVLDDVAMLARVSLWLCGFLIGSLLLSLGLTVRLIQTADVQPYVADGGVFGCQVPAIEEVRR